MVIAYTCPQGGPYGNTRSMGLSAECVAVGHELDACWPD
jgi:hypothetical protein